MINKIVVIGAGTMGNGIAHTFAQSGFEVCLVDVSQENLNKGMKTIETNLNRFLQKGTISEIEVKNTFQRIKSSTQLAECIPSADLVIEAATENSELKLNIFKELDKLSKPETILATNTSSISITKIASATSKPEKVIGMHFMNPVPIMKLVEIIRGYSTDSETTNTIVELCEKFDKIPVKVNDYPGFISNRVLMPMINEAICCLQEGVGGVEEIDAIMKLGMAHPMGPLELADFIGLDVCLYIMNVMYEGFKKMNYSASPLLVNMVEAKKLGKKTGEGFYVYGIGGKKEGVSKKLSRVML